MKKRRLLAEMKWKGSDSEDYENSSNIVIPILSFTDESLAKWIFSPKILRPGRISEKFRR
jgi:hypothetical protein